MQESLGGQRDSTKTAYVLVYVNDFVAKKSLEISPLDHVPANIKQEAQLYNTHFDQLYANQQAVEIARSIITRYNQRVKEQTQACANLSQTVSVKLLNFPTWLERDRNMQRLSQWLNMNIAVREELKHSDLRELSQQRNTDSVFMELCRHQPQGALTLTPMEEQTLRNYSQLFKLVKKKHAICTSFIKCLQLDGNKYQEAF